MMLHCFKRTFYLSLFFFACISQAQTNGGDPTRPLGYEQLSGEGVNGNGQSSIRLSSILFSSERKIAIINGQQLHENQTIKGIGAQVKKIEADAVTLQQGSKTWQVFLNETVIRK